jgi:MFS family permease
MLTGVLFLVFAGTGMTGALLTLYMTYLGANKSQIALILTVASISSVAFNFFWGGRSDSLAGRKPLLVTGLAGLAIAYILASMAPTFWLLLPLWLITSMSMAAYSTVSLAMVGDLLEGHRVRGRLMGTYRTFGSLSFGISTLVSGTIAEAFSLRVPMLIAGCFFVIALVLVFLIKEPVHEHNAKRADGQGQTQPKKPSVIMMLRTLWPLMITTLCWSIPMASAYSMWPLYMSSIGYEPAQVTGIWAVASLAEVPWMVAAGFIADRIGRPRLIVLGLLCIGLVFIGYVVLPGFPQILAPQMVRAFAFSAFTTASMVLATEMAAAVGRGRASGIYNMTLGVGTLFGNALGGNLVQLTGSYILLYQICAAIAITGALLSYLRLPAAFARRVQQADAESLKSQV